jgi:nucleoside-diphosphate-sugar epimerase
MVKNVFLTGASGFIGFHVTKHLLKTGYNVITSLRKDSLSSKKVTELKTAGIKIIEGNFYDSNILDQVFQKRIQYIIHLAAIRGVGYGSKDEYRTVNVLGTGIICEYAVRHNVELFIYISTTGVYGTIPVHLPADEETQLLPDDDYHISKFEGEKIIFNSLKDKIPFIILRPTTTYGLGDDGFLFKIINMVKNNSFVLIKDNIKIHLLDVVTIGYIIQQLMDKRIQTHQVLNVCDAKPVTLSDLVDLINQHFHNKKYPGFLRIPALFFKAAITFTIVFKLNKLNTSFKLIMYSRYYDVSKLVNFVSVELKETIPSISEYLKLHFRKK